MISKFSNIYIFLFSVFISVAFNTKAQVPVDAPVVPIPLKNIQQVDSAAILQAKYDSLVKHMEAMYHLDSTFDDEPTFVDANLKSATAIDTSASIPVSTQVIVEKTPEVVTTISTISTTININEQPLINTNNSTQNIPVVPASTQTINNTPQDTPKQKVILPKPKVEPKQHQPKQDTLLLDEEFDTEELLVDTLGADSLMDISDGDEADSEGEAEGEFDNLFTGYSDVTYWDMLRDPNFKFDPAMIPANSHYPFDWDTVVINPYKVSLREMNDTILLKLRDSMDCSFHPPAIGDVTSGFGYRRWGKRPKFHYGIDVRMEVGDPVYSIFDGVVRVAKRSTDYGYVVVVRHYNGLETLYAHFDQLLAYPGKPVRSGEIIGLSGNTGRSTGPHLHFEVRFKGEKIDPSKVIYFPSGSLLSDTLQIDKQCFTHVKLYKEQQTKLRSRYYVVKRGDTLGKIAYKNGVSVKQIARLNKISSKTKLKAGRRLRIR